MYYVGVPTHSGHQQKSATVRYTYVPQPRLPCRRRRAGSGSIQRQAQLLCHHIGPTQRHDRDRHIHSQAIHDLIQRAIASDAHDKLTLLIDLLGDPSGVILPLGYVNLRHKACRLEVRDDPVPPLQTNASA